MVVSNDEVLRAFGSMSKSFANDRSILTKCQTLCHTYDLTPERLAQKWDTYSCNSQASEVTLAHLDALRNTLNKEKSRRESQLRTPLIQKKHADLGFAPAAYGASPVVDDLSSELSAAYGVNIELRTPAPESRKRNAGDAMFSPSSFATPRTDASHRHPRGSGSGSLVGATPSSASLSRSDATRNGPFSPGSLASPPQVGGQLEASQAFAKRTNAGKVEVSVSVAPTSKFAELTPVARGAGFRAENIKLASFPNCQKESYRYMFEKLGLKSDIVDARIDSFGARIIKKHKLPDPSSVGDAKQESTMFVGQVCCDSEGKLNDRSTVLQGSRESSSGAKAALSLSSLDSYALFPGQVVAVRGVNSTGARIVAEELYLGAQLAHQKTPAAQLLKFNHGDEHLGGSALSLMVASGPFTCSTDFSYAPLRAFLEEVVERQPDLLFLLGPFVDAQHKELGTLPRTFEDEFQHVLREVVLPALERCSCTRLVVVPSLRDAHHDYVYPQPPFDAARFLTEAERKKVHFAPNPCTLSVNETTVGVTTADVLFHLGTQETARNPPGQASDRMGRLVDHLIKQRGYYPLKPAGVPLDFAHLPQTMFPNVTPDVLLLPSDLRHFVKDVSNTLAINPGRLAKGASGGTFAHTTIYPMRRNEIPADKPDKPMAHRVAKRAASEVVRV